MNDKLLNKLRKLRDEVEDVLVMEYDYTFSDYNALRDRAENEIKKMLKQIALDDN